MSRTSEFFLVERYFFELVQIIEEAQYTLTAYGECNYVGVFVKHYCTWYAGIKGLLVYF